MLLSECLNIFLNQCCINSHMYSVHIGHTITLSKCQIFSIISYASFFMRKTIIAAHIHHASI